MEKITIRAFRPAVDRDNTIRYVAEHARVLEDIGVYQALKMNYEWCSDPDSVVVVAEHEQLGMVGGVRLQLSRPGAPLPFENLLSPLDEDIKSTLSLLQPYGNAEICGLWNAHRFAGRGVPMLLTTAAVSMASQLGLRSIISISASYTIDYLIRCGFSCMKNLGSEGEFAFPAPYIRSYAMINMDLITLEAAEPAQRHRLIGLRMHPTQHRAEVPKRIPLHVEYQLLVQEAPDEHLRYAMVHQDRLRLSA